MDDSTWKEELTPILRLVQIITGAMVLGSSIFLVIVLVISHGEAATEQPLLTYVAALFAVAAIVVRTIVLRVMTASVRRSILRGTWKPPGSCSSSGTGQSCAPDTSEFLERTGDAGKIAMAFTTRTVIAGALLEGPTFFLLIAYFVERLPLGLLGAALLILGLLLSFPTRSRMVDWIENQLRLLEQERHLAG